MLGCYTRDESATGEAGRCCRPAPFHAGMPRRERRYPTGLTDAEGELIDPLLPDPPFISGAGGRPEAHCRRAAVDAVLYVVDSGIKWRALPVDFPPHSTVFKYFTRSEAAGATETVLDILRGRVRLAEGRQAARTAAVIDSAAVPGAETVGAGRAALMRARRATAASARSRWTPWACCCA